MAKKASVTSEKTSIRRIKASDDAPKKETVKKKTADKKAAKSVAAKKARAKSAVVKRDINAKTKNPFKAFGNYLRGAWVELKQVRWPTRGATWKMTLAVLIFSAIFVVLILLLDFGFNQLFELILR